MEFLMRPKGQKFAYEAQLEDLHKGSREWVSELKFWGNELSFLNNLIDKNFRKFIDKEKPLGAAHVMAELSELQEEKMPQLLKDIQNHEAHLGVLLENPFDPDDTAFRVEHDKIEKEISQFMKRYKALKNEIFKVTEEIMREEKPRHLLGPK